MKNLLLALILFIVAINIKALEMPTDSNMVLSVKYSVEFAKTIDADVKGVETYYGRKLSIKDIIEKNKHSVQGLLNKDEIHIKDGSTINSNEIEYFRFQTRIGNEGGKGKIPVIGF